MNSAEQGRPLATIVQDLTSPTVIVLLVGCDEDAAMRLEVMTSMPRGKRVAFRRIDPKTPDEHLELHRQAGDLEHVCEYVKLKSRGGKLFYPRENGDGLALMIREIWKIRA